MSISAASRIRLVHAWMIEHMGDEALDAKDSNLNRAFPCGLARKLKRLKA
jgi:hypothetical protein